jgi:holo-[acyl-carrier protein] synthase
LNSKKKSRFLNKIFSSSEISDSNNRQNQSEYFSGRFAAKEAIKKALSSYNETNMPSFKSLEILNSESGKPYVLISSERQSNIKHMKFVTDFFGLYDVMHVSKWTQKC